ncbi:MAG: aldo/keto reductase [Gemmiger sp.]|nr:aldo/keto reductase [Gemmiger sp.]
MEYRVNRHGGEKTSLLGLGMMRLPLRDPADPTSIDEEKAQQIVDYAYAHGVNYFDTAYPYHGRMSEKFCGRALARYPRQSYHLASKLPGWLVNGAEDVPRLFEEQLQNCQTPYFDFYLCHSVHEENWPRYQAANAYAQLDERRQKGQIHNLGFSFHGGVPLLKEVLAAGKWDFVQLQLNYFDWDYQDARTKYELCAAAGLQVVVMEPVRGGGLATLCDSAAALLQQAAPDASLARWAIRWAAGLPGVLCVLSGMSTLEQVVDNTAAMAPFIPLTTAEQATLADALAAIKAQKLVPCTTCKYCMPCPAGVNIPGMLRIYNEYRLHGEIPARLRESYNEAPEPTRAAHCVACGKCKAQCPQQIDIPAHMATIAALAKE